MVICFKNVQIVTEMSLTTLFMDDFASSLGVFLGLNSSYSSISNIFASFYKVKGDIQLFSASISVKEFVENPSRFGFFHKVIINLCIKEKRSFIDEKRG